MASKVAQPASYTVDNKKWLTIKRGMIIPKRSWIRTGHRGRLVLKRGKEMIMYRQKTMAYLRSSQTNGRKTYLQQSYGSLLLDVETRRRKHVTVKTPLLAAVVKGTRFEVTVNKKRAIVSVKRGVVGVRSNKSGRSVDITSGQSAGVDSTSSRQVSVSGKGVSNIASSARIFSNANSGSNSNGSGNGNANGSSNGNSNGGGNGSSNGNSNGNGNGNSNGCSATI